MRLMAALKNNLPVSIYPTFKLSHLQKRFISLSEV